MRYHDSIGGDTHIWTPDGKAHPISGLKEIPYEAALEIGRRLMRMGNPINPKRTSDELWSDKSAKRISDLRSRADNIKQNIKRAREIAREMGIDIRDAVAVKIPGKLGLANAVLNSGNMKTGPCGVTNAAQTSCPDGKNNKARFRCPLYDSGCYAESGMQNNTHTLKLNAVAGLDRKTAKSKFTPLDVAKDEAAALTAFYPFWSLLALNNGVRLHVVGDAVTPECARVISKAIDPYVDPRGLQGLGTNPGPGVKNVWNYTHAWRTVPRSAWHKGISVLASCDRIEDLEAAHAQGYGCAIVVPDYLQDEMGKYKGNAFDAGNGFRLIPCPYEVREKNDKDERIWCTECRLCLRDDLLYKNKAAIAFAAHTGKAKVVSGNLINIKKLKGDAK